MNSPKTPPVADNLLPSTEQSILYQLNCIEQDYKIVVLYAAEAGSRAWGFPSSDSDYDIRFIYFKRLKEQLKVHPGSDNIERMCAPDQDFAGWDLRKTLHLLSKSNAALLEWLHSPIIYVGPKLFRMELAALARNFAEGTPLVKHYANMAQRCLSDHLIKKPMIKMKKYFYAVRPLLAAQWVQNHTAATGYVLLPPVSFMELFEQSTMSNEMRRKIKDLYNRKIASSSETQLEAADMDLLDWVQSGIMNFNKIQLPPYKFKPEIDVLDDFLYRWTIVEDLE